MYKCIKKVLVLSLLVFSITYIFSTLNSKVVSTVRAESTSPTRIEKEKTKLREIKTEVISEASSSTQKSNIVLQNIIKNGPGIKTAVWSGVGWSYHKQLTLINTGTSVVNSSSSVTISVDTSALESVLANCNDIRVIYQGITEVPITVKKEIGSTNCSDSKSTKITFPLQSNLLSGIYYTKDYELYYGNNLAGAPDSIDGYSIPGGPVATMVCSFNGTTTCETGQTPTTESGAIRYSGQKSALNFDGFNDYLTITSPQVNNNFTIEFWAKPTSEISIQTEANSGTNCFNTNSGFVVSNEYGWPGSRTGTGVVVGTNGVMVCEHTGWYFPVLLAYTTPITDWTHIAIIYENKTPSLFINGVKVRTGLTSSVEFVDVNALSIGRQTTNGRYYHGLLDEIRISNSIRYSSNFTPQTTAFLTDTNTALLYHFDENGDDPRYAGKTIDASGNGNHGTITGAKYVSGLVGVDNSVTTTGKLPSQSYASHQGVLLEEGTTNLITNPSFENATYDLNWSVNNLTKTKNTTSPQFKFGSSSTKLVAAGVNGEFTTTAQSPTLNSSLSFYVYNGTSGAIGTTVDNTVAELYSPGKTLTTTYEDTGGGWWRLVSTDNFAEKVINDFSNMDANQPLNSTSFD